MSRGKTNNTTRSTNVRRPLKLGIKNLPKITAHTIENWRGWDGPLGSILPQHIKASEIPNYKGTHEVLRAVNPSESWFLHVLKDLDVDFWWEPTLFSWESKDRDGNKNHGGFKPDVYLPEYNLRIELTVNNDYLPGLYKKRAKVQLIADHYPDNQMALFEAEDFVHLSTLARRGQLDKESFLAYAHSKIRKPKNEPERKIKVYCETKGEKPRLPAPTNTNGYSRRQGIRGHARKNGWDVERDYLELPYAHYAVGRLIPQLVEEGNMTEEQARAYRKKFRRHIRGSNPITLDKLVRLGETNGTALGKKVLQERARMHKEAELRRLGKV